MSKAIIFTSEPSEKEGQHQSTKEQADLCQAYADRNELEIWEVYTDYGKSGTSILNEVMHLIVAEEIRWVLVASLDKLSRDRLIAASVAHCVELLGGKLVDMSSEARRAA